MTLSILATPFPKHRPAWAVIPLLLALAACGKGQGGGAGGPGFHGPPPAAVTFQTVATEDIPVEYEYVGQTAGSREVEIRARVNGIIEKRLYEEGSPVKAGQPLFKLDAALYAAAVAEAEATLVSAEASLKQAEREYNRLKPLLETQAISQKESDSAASAFDIARAEKKRAEARLASTRVELGYTQITAPITGMVGRALKVEGALVNAASDSLLATLAQMDPIHVNFTIAERVRNEVQSELASGSLKLPSEGYTVKLKTADGQWLKPVGKLNFSDYKADANTGAYAARASFPNADGSLTPGQFVRVVLAGAIRPSAIAVPQRAVLEGPQGKFVYVVG
ncbi:MAG: efflux RND transporter periplasmic adaptor subunit, partial [Betaproteobacteria bacterium]|nr:efflux RND transporter periplasmic adaptor subunit [Betaproteobacteria bacterium]